VEQACLSSRPGESLAGEGRKHEMDLISDPGHEVPSPYPIGPCLIAEEDEAYPLAR